MIDNGCSYTKDLVLKFLTTYLDVYIEPKKHKYYTNIIKVSSLSTETASKIADYVFTKKDCLTMDELIELTKRRIILTSPIKIGLDINCDKFREFCTKVEYNPYPFLTTGR